MNKKIKSEWFRHDYLSRNDPKIMRLIFDHGLEGYGLYWCIVEAIYTNDGSYNSNDIKYLAASLHVEESKINDIVNSDLFVKTEGIITSKRIINELKERNEISETKRKAAEKRWSKDS